jgi:hypothetical protein
MGWNPIDWLTGEDKAKKAREQAAEIAATSQAAQTAYVDKSLKAYMDYMDKALKASGEGTDKAIAAQLAGGQASADLARAGAAQRMNWSLPTQAASLSALQALPQLQMLMGMPAYDLPTSIDQSLPPSVNLAQLYQNAQGGGAGAASGGAGAATPGNFALKPYSGKAIDVTASPLFKWQNKQMQENVNRNLAARGFGSSPAAAAILADEYSKLTGAETDKTVSRLQQMVGMGAGMPGATGGEAAGTTMANATGNIGSNLSNIYNQAANARAGLYEQAGQTQAAAYSGLGQSIGQMGAAQAQARAQQTGTSPLSLLTSLYSIYNAPVTGARL